jgi:hypothetical protein
VQSAAKALRIFLVTEIAPFAVCFAAFRFFGGGLAAPLGVILSVLLLKNIKQL